MAQSRADALVDLVLSDVQVSTTATLVIPTTSAPAADPAVHPEPDETTEPETEPETAAEPAPTATADPPGAADPHGAADVDGAAVCGQPTVPTADPVPTAAPARPAAAGPRRLTPPSCDCASRSRSWVELLAALDRPGVVLTGPWAADLPDPPVQRQRPDQGAPGDRGGCQPAPGPRRARTSLVRAQTSHQPTRRPTAAGAGERDPRRPGHHHPPRAQPTRTPAPSSSWTSRPTAPAPSWPGWCEPGMAPAGTRLRHPRGTVRPGPCHRLPARPHVGGQPAESLPDASRVQAPRRLDRHHDPRRRVHLDRPQRTQPHHPPPQPARRRRLAGN